MGAEELRVSGLGRLGIVGRREEWSSWARKDGVRRWTGGGGQLGRGFSSDVLIER